VELASRRDAELRALGWVRMFTVERERAAEYVEAYEASGLEVLVEPSSVPQPPPECEGCAGCVDERFSTIYTRQSPVAAH